MAKPRLTYAERLQQQHSRIFVGRIEERYVFRHNFTSELPNYLIFSIYGQAGIGKSRLVEEYQAIARANGALAALTNEVEAGPIREQSILRAMARLAMELADSNAPLKAFNERYHRYRECMQQVEADPDAPQEVFDLLGRTVARLALGGAKMTPLGQAVSGFIKDIGGDDEVLVEQAGKWTNYLAKKFKDKDDVALIREPVENLTPIFVSDVNELAEEQTVVLSFDTWERTSAHLGDWLRRLLQREGLSEGVWLVIAGRNPLRDEWQPFYPLMAVFELKEFTEDETRNYLQKKGITEETRVSEILAFTGGNPLLVSTLASAKGGSATEVTEGLVGRYLSWVDNPRQRQVALYCATARRLNKDVIEAVMDADNAEALSQWLIGMPFVQSRPGYWEYHPKVRHLILEFVQKWSVKDSRKVHSKIQAYYMDQLAKKGKDPLYHDEVWRQCMLEALYHGLMREDDQAICFGLETFLLALRSHYPLAGEVVLTWQQAADEQNLTNEVSRWAGLLSAGWAAFENRSWEAVLSLCNALSTRKDLGNAAKAEVYLLGGYVHAGLEMHERAVQQFGQALSLDHYSLLAIIGRGETYRVMDCYEEAIADFTRALEIDPNDASVLSSRGVTYRQMKCFAEALADLDRAIELEPDYASAFIHRGETYRLMERFDEALDDMNRAIELRPGHEWALASGGETYRLMERYVEALADLNRAIELKSDYGWALASRGATLQRLGRYDDALADLNRALELKPEDERALFHRGEVYRALGQYEQSVTDLSRAIELTPDDFECYLFASRGETYRLMRRFDEALADMNRALELKKDYEWALLNRGVTHLQLEHYEEALDDLNQAIELKPDSTWALASRGETYRLMGSFDEALIDLDKAIELKPGNFWAFACRGETYRQMGHCEKALADLEQAIELKPDYGWPYYNRGLLYKSQGKWEDAIAEFREVLRINQNPDLRGQARKLLKALEKE